jgi:hypothetical protein
LFRPGHQGIFAGADLSVGIKGDLASPAVTVSINLPYVEATFYWNGSASTSVIWFALFAAHSFF